MPCTGDEFTLYKYVATGAPDPAGRRTQPDREADVQNVKDFGAKGDNSTDDFAKIQAAINYAMSLGGGIVFFPAGIYITSQPLNCGGSTNAPVQIVGCGKGSTQLKHAAGFTDPLGLGYDISGGYEINAFDNLERVEGIAGVTVRLTRSGSSAVNLSGGVNAASAKGAMILNCTGGGQGTAANTWTGPPNIPGTSPGSVGFAIGTGVIDGCRGVGGAEVGYALSGSGSSIFCSSWEQGGCVVRVGWAFPLTWSGSLVSSSSANTVVFSKALPGEVVLGRFVSGTNIPANTMITAISTDRKTITLSNNTTGSVTSITFGQETPCTGGTVQGLETERIWTGVELYNCDSILVSGNYITADDGGPPLIIPFSTATWASGVATMTSSLNLNFPGGIGAHGIVALGNDGPPFQNNSWIPAGATELLVLATQTTPNQFTYSLPATPSAWTNGTGDGWTWPPLAYMRFRKWKNCMVTGNEGNRAVYRAAYDFDYDGTSVASGNNIFQANDANSFGYIMPTNAASLASIKYLNVSQSGSFGQNLTGLASQFVNPFITWAQLPGNGVALQPRSLGQEYVITDANNTAFRGNVTGSSPGNNVKVRWNGSNWTACG